MLLLFQKPRNLSNRLLGGLILLFSIELICIGFFDKLIGLQFSSPIHILLLAVVNFLFLYGVLFYFYVRSVVYEINRFSPRNLRHLLPFFFFLLVSIIQYLTQRGPPDNSFLTVFIILYLLMIILGGVYLILALRLLRRYRIKTRHKYSNPDKINLNWLTNITGLQILLWGIAILNGVLLFINGFSGVDGSINTTGLDEIFYLLMTAVILYCGYFALRHPETFNLHLPLKPIPEPEVPEEPDNKAEQGLYKQLLKVMVQQKPYLNPDLTIDDLSAVTRIPVYLLSRIINRYSGNNFFNFINTYRVEEVKSRLADSTTGNESLLSIALDCGFSSKTTFNTIFKKATQQTPSQYRRQATLSG